MSRPQTRGKPVNVITNSFEITGLPTKEYTQYDVVITPELGKSLARKRQEIIHKLQTLIAPEIFSPRAIYDGRAILYASRPLRLPSGDGGSFTVSLTAAPPAPGARGSYEVKLTKTIGASVNATDMMRLVKGRTADNQTTMATNLLQLLVRQAPNQKYAHNGRAYFTPEGSKNIGSGLELWRGYFQSVRPTIDRMLVNVDTTITAVYAKGDLITVCLLFLNKGNDVRLLTGDERDQNFRALEKHLHNLLINVVTTGNRTKAIRGLVPSAGKYEFSKDDRVTTIEEHYKEAHNRTIKHPNAFGVRLTKPNAPFQVIVPAELCTIIPGQLYRKRIPDHLTKAVVDFATVKPNDRLRQIQTGDGAMESPVKGYKNSEFILEAGMTIETRPITIKGRILDTPSLRYGGDREVKPRDGSWNVKGQQFQTPRPMMTWATVNFCPERISAVACEGLMKALVGSCGRQGMPTGPPVAIESGISFAVEKALTSVLSKAQTKLGSNFKKESFIVIVVLSGKMKAVRARVKHWGDITEGVLTQCLCDDKVLKANDQYWGNVALKLNARLGGYNALTRSTVLQELQKQPFMIMGADVGHPSPGVRKPSVTSLVWSYDEYATRYAAYTRIQHPRLEVIDGLKDMIKDAITAFGMRNRASPKRVIFFRDGVSEGEFESIAEKEVGAIKDAIDEIWNERKLQDTKPLLTFIVVGKRHHVVFFPQDESSQDRTGNVRAGFVADEGLRHPVTLDFYLQSHAAVKGTSRSSHYSVLLDENFSANIDKLQELAFALCHVYAKATRSVSIPAPVYYADLVCARGEFHFRPDSNLAFTDDSTMTSNSAPFDIAPWEKGFLPVNRASNKTMYFL